MKEPAQASVQRINPVQQLAFVKSDRDGVISLTRSWFPRWFLPRENLRQTIQIADQTSIEWLIEREQRSLVGQKLPDCDFFFTVLAKLRPIRANAFIVVEPASRMREGESHRRETFSCRVD